MTDPLLIPPPPLKRHVEPETGAVLVAAAAGLAAFAAFIPLLEAVRPDDVPFGFPAAFLGGFAVAVLYWSGFRAAGLIPPAATLAVGAAAVVAATGSVPAAAAVAGQVGVGLGIGAVVRFAWRNALGVILRPSVHANHAAKSSWTDRILAAIFGLGFVLTAVLMGGFRAEPWARGFFAYNFAVWGLLFVGFAWVKLFRPFFELCVEPVLWVGYAVKGSGPGVGNVPYHGPMLVIANHACFWDPLFLAKVLPRPITPMMTKLFFDKWFLRPLMVHVFRVIRVDEVAVRRDVPEIAEAVAALDAGRCVVIFPEAFLRRKEEQPLRRFGRGVIEILKARPDTPVLPCWIEGAWGSRTSYAGGPPGEGKPRDVRRPIRVAVGVPERVPPEWLADHLPGRLGLMDRVKAARATLGLPPIDGPGSP